MKQIKYIGYVAGTKRVPIDRQIRTVEKFNPLTIIQDDVEAAIKLVRRGRALVVRQASVLSRGRRELKRICRAVHDNGGYIHEAITGRCTMNAVDAFEMGLDANRRRPMTSEQASDIAGRRPKHSKEYIETWRAHWFDRRLTTEGVEKRSGISKSTLRRYFGARGLKAGRRPNKRK